MIRSGSTRLRRTGLHSTSALTLVSLLAWLGAPLVASAEGTAQLNTTQALRQGTVLYVDIVDASSETIEWTGNGTVTVEAPDTSSVATLSSGSNTGSLAAYGNGAYKLTVNSDQVVFSTWDVTVLNQTSAGGRLHSYDWRFNAGAFTEDRATDASFYAKVPGGGVGQSAVIELKLDGLAGYVYQINANRVGVDGAAGGTSVPRAGESVTPEFAMYLQPPTNSTYSSSSPVVSGLAFVGGTSTDWEGNPMTPCNQIVSGGTTANFLFTSSVEGTYHISCDLDEDGSYEKTNGDDLLIVGEAVSGFNSVEWDGLHQSSPVPNGSYNCRVEVNVGEFHYVGEDIETSYPGMRLYEVDASAVGAAASDANRTPLTMWWNDAAVQSNALLMPNGAYGTESSGEEGIGSGSYSTSTDPNVNARSWGNWVFNGKGNEAFLDTYTYLESGQSTVVTFTSADFSLDSDGDGAGDFEEECMFGTDKNDPDTDNDGTNDGDQYGGQGASSGAGNGLESNGRLAEQIARRAIARSRQTFAPAPLANESSPLAALAPAGDRFGWTSQETTPDDLVELTNATEVFARDYFDASGERVAGILLIETRGEVYEHSKSVCDRAGGSSLDAVSISRARGHDLLRSQLKRSAEGLRDHTTTFALHESADGQAATVYSYWLRTDYPEAAPGARVVRVQTWGSLPGAELSLSDAVLEAAGEYYAQLRRPGEGEYLSDEEIDAGITQPAVAAPASLPDRTFREARMLGQNLYLVLNPAVENSNEDLALRIVGLHEDAQTESVELRPLLPQPEGRVLHLDATGRLDVTLELLVGGEVQDRIWLSDGAWAAYDDGLWSGATQVNFSRETCTSRPGRGQLALAGCGRSEGEVMGELGFAGVARHLAHPLDLSSYSSVGAHIESSGGVRMCLETDTGRRYCDQLGSARGWVERHFQNFVDDSGERVPTDARVRFVALFVEGAGPMRLEASGLHFGQLAAPQPEEAASSTGGCSLGGGFGTGFSWALALLAVARWRRS